MGPSGTHRDISVKDVPERWSHQPSSRELSPKRGGLVEALHTKTLSLFKLGDGEDNTREACKTAESELQGKGVVMPCVLARREFPRSG